MPQQKSLTSSIKICAILCMHIYFPQVHITCRPVLILQEEVVGGLRGAMGGSESMSNINEGEGGKEEEEGGDNKDGETYYGRALPLLGLTRSVYVERSCIKHKILVPVDTA